MDFEGSLMWVERKLDWFSRTMTSKLRYPALTYGILAILGFTVGIIGAINNQMLIAVCGLTASSISFFGSLSLTQVDSKK